MAQPIHITIKAPNIGTEGRLCDATVTLTLERRVYDLMVRETDVNDNAKLGLAVLEALQRIQRAGERIEVRT